ncbi:hypothetical protein QQS21_005932 [Conoideocrella luteorostrata]|uniref:rRNA methyltransferase 1, mitochondrial n=1 Tax=Conoideocrella luteorostrata TaxID=1105319 RepID=A0AAJ0FTD7_9HYPO|nr:hypothetical protein QQS21_005932 [Conoideocrella luteorostrata]
MISAKQALRGSRFALRCSSKSNATATAPGTVRLASLSAIHRGLRRSERAQHGEPRSWESRFAGRRSDDGFSRTNKALDGAASARQQQKLRKKLDRKASEVEDEDDTCRQTRRKRFLDPEFSFGKRSLVYQLKHGSLKDTAASLKLQEPVRPRSFAHRDDDRRRSNRGRQDERPRSRQFTTRDDHQQRRGSRDRHEESRLQPRRDQDDDFIDDSPSQPKKRGVMPMIITYTTAASQFLYGKSVVKAALEQRRRQIYKLYVYRGENRRDSRDNDMMIHLARSQGVPVTIVPHSDQRLMDKMSMGRPHNGFVLETSPLPQIPVKSLAQLEESPSRLGFHIDLDHQTVEQKAINGETTFVSKARNSASKPFVLLLHEILDPGNLGALLRTASYMGIDAVAITSRNSSTLTPVVLKSAAGAAEEVTIFTVDSPVKFLEDSRASGWKIYAAVPPPEKKLVKMHGDKFISVEDIEQTAPLDQDPCILVLGNEGHGLPRTVKVAADFELSVPKFVQGSSVDSLNVSVAAGLLCHSFMKGSAMKKSEQGQEANAKKPPTEPGESFF